MTVMQDKIEAINKYENLIKKLNIEKNKDDKLYFDYFFKKKFIHIKNKKIIYPKIDEVKRIIFNLKKELKKTKVSEKIWMKKKKTAENYHNKIDYSKILTKKYWKHKIKQIINKDYKQDCIDAKLTDHILMDPEYKNLFNTFLVDPDYRKKLKETINNSIVYNNRKIGEYSKIKQKFKYEIAMNKLIKIILKIKKIKYDIESNKRVLTIIRKFS